MALLALGLIEVAAGLGRPWRWLVEALLLAVLALGFLVAAQRSHGRRFAWLLSGSIAAGLALAASYNLIAATATPAVPVAGVAIFVAIMLLLMHRIARKPPRR